MRSLDILLAFEVGDGSDHLQDARIGTRAQTEFIDGQLEKLLAGFIDLAELLDVTVGHLGIAVNLHSLESGELNLAGCVDALLNLTGRFPWIAAGKVSVLHSRDLDVDIDSVHQRTGDL